MRDVTDPLTEGVEVVRVDRETGPPPTDSGFRLLVGGRREAAELPPLRLEDDDDEENLRDRGSMPGPDFC